MPRRRRLRRRRSLFASATASIGTCCAIGRAAFPLRRTAPGAAAVSSATTSIRACSMRAIARLEALGGQRVLIDFAPLHRDRAAAVRGTLGCRALPRDRVAAAPNARGVAPGDASDHRRGRATAAPRMRSARSIGCRHCAARAEAVWEEIDVLLTPTAGTIYRIAEIEADPMRLNSNLGYYTNFMNLLDLAAVAVPAGIHARDRAVWRHAAAARPGATMTCWHLPRSTAAPRPTGQGALRHRAAGGARVRVDRPPDAIPVAVCGAHMEGLPLNHQLTRARCRAARTHAHGRPISLLCAARRTAAPTRPGTR